MSELARWLSEANAHLVELERLVKVYGDALGGIGSCATACPCCAMHARVARQALAEPLPNDDKGEEL